MENTSKISFKIQHSKPQKWLQGILISALILHSLPPQGVLIQQRKKLLIEIT